MTIPKNPVLSHARVEFRIPISPTGRFFSQVRFFNFALRRLSASHYRNAKLRIVVGDHCDLNDVRRQNAWSEDFDIAWERTPDDVFDEFNWAGTANWRLCIPADDADVVVLSDADTVLLRDVDPLLGAIPLTVPAVYGHMAHYPPYLGDGSAAPSPETPEFWPWLFDAFGVRGEHAIQRYSMDTKATLPLAPAYFNLGFVALNAKALSICAAEIASVTRRIAALTDSFMRCQIAISIIAYRAGMSIGLLPAEYNAANDAVHLANNGLTVERIRVLHYLREEEADRGVLQPECIDEYLSRKLVNPASIALQDLAREYRETLT